MNRRAFTKSAAVTGLAALAGRFSAPGLYASEPQRKPASRYIDVHTHIGTTWNGDEELTPVRGQLAVLQPQDDVRYAFTGDAGYMFPRKDGILLGGTFERGEWDATPQSAAIARIISRHRRLSAGFRCAA